MERRLPCPYKSGLAMTIRKRFVMTNNITEDNGKERRREK